MRLDRLLVNLAYGSRSNVQKLIRSGRVRISGQIVKDPAYQAETYISVDGQMVDTRLNRVLMMNKPSGMLTAADDKNARTVMDLLPPIYRTLECMPVGRLDKDTTGLLLFTTDGELAHRLISPKYGIKKVYLATVDTDLCEQDIKKFREGIHFKDFDAQPAELEIINPRLAKITISEGKFHQVKRMLHAVGHETLALERISFGPFDLDKSLALGAYREMTDEEIRILKEAVAKI